ncbi:aldehyde dehydrogenase family protein [Noviherbaspirillum aerium]|uniref:aldehyde dehydrogenase family protein n=1 Tax=Noviherbaspirillum aerium TaxID=2588497 RepID=UPI00124EBAAC|nr:aldehyde dehydrogenase family protein [Noviherbaspirillum aerium]
MHANHINGRWVESAHAAPNINPSNLAESLGDYAHADEAQTQDAITAAHSALDDWRCGSVQARVDSLDLIGTELLARRQELGKLLAQEEGKTLPEAIGEVARAGYIFKYFSQEALRPDSRITPSVRQGLTVETLREPVGVVGIITPWNFPIAIPAWKIAPALAFGNTVVFKPAELVPGSAWALAEIISRSGIPPGVFNLVNGRGSAVGAAMTSDLRIDALTFTGSVGTGQKIAQALAGRTTRLQMEMGGKNPLVVTDDASLERAVECAVQGAFYSTGQRCTASSRIIVTRGIHQRFVEAFRAKAESLVVGHALDPDTQIGPVVDESQLEQDLAYIAIGKNEGATLAWGGQRVARATNGLFLQPALFVDCDNSMLICKEEIFGPVAAVIPANDYEHALHIANDTPFGLCAGICTTSLGIAQHFKTHSRAGMVMVNAPTAGVDYHVPFGGAKASSYGSHEQGPAAQEFYTTTKTAYICP